MTTLLERPKSRSGAATALSGTLPQVNLLPPEVRAARGLRAIKRMLGIGLIAVVLACVAAFALASVSEAAAKSELAQAQDQTARLQAEQKKYAEVPQVLAALDDAKTAQALGMATDVQWKAYVDALTAVLPAEVSIDTYAVTVSTPMTLPAPPADPLQAPSIGQLSFTARSTVVPNTSAWIDSLNSVPGFADAWVSDTSITEDESGIYYNVTATVQVTDGAFSHRFDPVDGEG